MTAIKQLLFLHGAGTPAEDRPLAEALAAAFGAQLTMPQWPENDHAVDHWTGPIERYLGALGPRDLVVAHSFGASMLLRTVDRGVRIPCPAVLLAMPDWGPDGWDVVDYAFTGTGPDTTLVLHHCRDDAVVPFDHLARNSERLPSAWTVAHLIGGHQFDDLAESIVHIPGGSR